MTKLNLSDIFKNAFIDEKNRLCKFYPKIDFADYHETHLSYAIGNYLANMNYSIILQARNCEYYNDLCDLYAESSNKEKLWIEIKRGWHGIKQNSDENWNSKPKAQIVSWIDDILKLRKIKSGKRYFVLLFFRQNNLQNDIKDNEYDCKYLEIETKLAKAIRNNGNIDGVLNKVRLSAHFIDRLFYRTLKKMNLKPACYTELTSSKDKYKYTLYICKV